MKMNLKFICNNTLIETEAKAGMSLLDYIRKDLRLTGSKEGCREGDCGACTVLIGSLLNDSVVYSSVNSCIMPIGDINGKHLVTIEGLSKDELNQIQKDFVEFGASQCGFCTPGFIISLCGYFLSTNKLNSKDAVDALDGNVCRCTGYESIRNAIDTSIKKLTPVNNDGVEHLQNLINCNYIPEYFLSIPNRLKELKTILVDTNGEQTNKQIVGGGTDLLVQRWEEIQESDVNLIFNSDGQNKISAEDGICKIKATATVTEFCESEIIKKHFPKITESLHLFGSLPIRNRATLGGNIINASPIADMTSVLLALNSKLFVKGTEVKKIMLNDFYTGYKTMKLERGELLDEIHIPIPSSKFLFNFEKISRRTYLDIASVNSSIKLEVENNVINVAYISAGGVSPIPLYLNETSEYLLQKEINIETIKGAAELALKEIAPISDARGTAEYKSTLLRNLIFAHFEKFYPNLIDAEVIQ